MIDKSGSGEAEARSRGIRIRAMIDAARTAAAAVRPRGSCADRFQWGPTGLPPDVIPGYDLLEEIHRGGQGVVYRGTQRSTQRTVAIKVLKEGPFAGDVDRLRFEREVSILAQLDHRNIIGVLDRGTAAGSHFLVMDFVDGRPLDRYVRDDGLGLAARLRLFARVCDAVGAAHLRGVIHRDIKPSNVLVDRAGEPRVLDFGLAKVADVEASAAVQATQTGQFIGSLPWASPEQAGGLHAGVDIRSDVYSLGVVLYQLLTDRLPIPVAGTLEEILAAIRSTVPGRPSSISTGIDDDLDTIALKCLMKEPARRYQSVGELARDVRHYLAQEPIEAKRDSAWYVVRKMVSRHRAVATLAMMVVVIVLVAAGVMLRLWRTATHERDRAFAAVDRADSEATKSRQLARFSQGMLAGIDPAVAGGMDKKLMRMMLEDASKRVDLELAQQPESAAAIHFTIGKAYRALGEHDAAQRHLSRSRAMRHDARGEENADTLAAMDELAMLHYDRSEYQQAEELCRTALAGRRRVLGPEHRDTLLSMSNLAEILEAAGKMPDGEELCQETLELRMRVLGPEDPDTLTSLSNRANQHNQAGRFDIAEPIYRQVIEVQRRIKGDQHPHTISTRNNLAILLGYSGRPGESEPILREVLAARQSVLGEEHPDTLSSRANLANLLQRTRKLDEAEALMRGLIEVDRRVLGPRHSLLALHLSTHAAILLDSGDGAGAEVLSREALDIRRAVLPAGHWEIAVSELNLGTLLVRVRRFAEAEPLLLSGYHVFEKSPQVQASWRIGTARAIVNFYEAWEAAEPGRGKLELAAQWRRKLPTTQPSSSPSG